MNHENPGENIGTNIATKMEEILSSIPPTGSNPETEGLTDELRDALFPPSYISELKAMGIDVGKVYSSVSRKKVEITMAIKHPHGERLVTIRYKRGEDGFISVTKGLLEWEKTIKEVRLPDTVEQTTIRVKGLIEELMSEK